MISVCYFTRNRLVKRSSTFSRWWHRVRRARSHTSNATSIPSNPFRDFGRSRSTTAEETTSIVWPVSRRDATSFGDDSGLLTRRAPGQLGRFRIKSDVCCQRCFPALCDENLSLRRTGKWM
ncbi:hypothetical protein GWI33_021152 [Rhynchophorus ferrugineus]|uniref:Uncharacterized protein n=1 Tax=Rhynchophorus ferrugineus TaxID=354439 RepID=A0A834LZX9_RHYFE|nr:hypothetical protein GWI33_021152 [Rhynchophorus ferrugineus]